MVEDHYLHRAGGFLQQSLDLWIVHLTHLFLVVKVCHLAVMVREHEPLPV